FVGGISLNYAVQAKRAGAAQVSLVSRVGTDAAGRQILAKLAQEGVDASRVLPLVGKSAECAIEILDGGERYFPPNSYHQHVLKEFRPNTADLTFIQKHDVLMSLYDQSHLNLVFDDLMLMMPFDGFRAADFGDWLDYDGGHDVIPPYLDALDLAFISGDENAIAYLQPFAAQSNCLFVVTMGANGSVALDGTTRLFQPAIPVPNLVDTTGCGDAFQANFTVNYVRDRQIKQALNAGATAASATIQHLGAT
ncbi:MAG: PfkB family carbohydrate kinase, partial [Candidatus Promineifilaceae bacterium]